MQSRHLNFQIFLVFLRAFQSFVQSFVFFSELEDRRIGDFYKKGQQIAMPLICSYRVVPLLQLQYSIDELGNFFLLER